MHNTDRLLRVMIEMIFILAGAFLLWVAFTGRYFFDPRRPAWLALSALLIFWGLRTWQRARRATAGASWRAADKIAGASLALAGLLLLLLAWTPFRWVDLLLGAAGSVFVLRGLLSAALMAWPS